MSKPIGLVLLMFSFICNVSGQTRVEAENWSAMSGVLTESTSDVGGGINVGWIDQGDWLEYSINCATTGSYRLDLRIASGGENGRMQIKNAAGTILTTVNVPFTYGYQNWQTISTYIPLTQGTQTIRLQSSAVVGWNLNWFEVSTNVTSKIQAEHYTAMSGIQKDYAHGDGIDSCVNFIDLNDWMEYSFDAPHPGVYTVYVRASAQNPGAQLQILKGGALLVTAPLPNTGNYQVWATVSTTVNITTAGIQTLRIQSSASANWNFNWMELVAPPASTVVNDPPIINSGPDQTVIIPSGALTANTIQLSGSATDPDGNALTYSWTKVSGPAAGSITTPSASSTTFTGAVEGIYIYRLTVSDGIASPSDDVSITVEPAPAGSGWSLFGNALANSATQFLGTSNVQPVILKTNGLERLRIAADGKIGINTNAPVNASIDPILSVNGTVWARRLKITQSTWADFVFEPSYKLRSLSNLESYIKKNKHLPGVPSASNVKAEGLDLGETQAILLKKIEELTLYVIEQNKTIIKIQSELNALRKRAIK